ncbi:MAG: TIM barrel protein, partial [Hyphomicrobiales bacterium]|nr:TIM barrel protein [Hyphomicrobiales bacterium]MBV8663772.1 TIM barrel protein [Hyphomicrobiales bacterium]
AEIAARLRANGLTQALFNLPAGFWAKGERGLACLPDRIADFRAGVDKAIDYAQALDCRTVNCLAGIPAPGATAQESRRTLIENFRYAARRLESAGVLMVVEPINPFDMPGFLLNHSASALAAIDEAGVDNIKLQYDIYHMQRMEGELALTIERLIDRIGHIQIAGNPGRHEPDVGEINYPFLTERLDALGYDGWIGAEYRPRGRTEDGLGWLAAYSAS